MEVIKKDSYTIRKHSIQSNNINIKCYNIINIIENIIHNEPVSINNYTNVLIYRRMNIKCCKCNDNAEYYLSDDKIYCWKHSQYIS
jgi:hypothetical protein